MYDVTDAKWALHTMPSKYPPTAAWTKPDRNAACIGTKHSDHTPPRSSLVITRDLRSSMYRAIHIIVPIFAFLAWTDGAKLEINQPNKHAMLC